MPKQQYSILEQHDEAHEKAEQGIPLLTTQDDPSSPSTPIFSEHKPSRSQTQPNGLILPLAILSIILLLWVPISLILIFRLSTEIQSLSNPPPSTEPFLRPLLPTEFAPAASALSALPPFKYPGHLAWNTTTDNITWEHSPSSPSSHFFGPPSKEMDSNWTSLLHDEFFTLHPTEMERPSPQAPEWDPPLQPLPDGDYFIELQVMHNLHCLNAIRKAVDHEYYSKPENMDKEMEGLIEAGGGEPFRRMHMDHCLQMLFEGIKCESDMTPVPLYYEMGKRIAVGRGMEHTCRDFGAVRRWYDERNAERLGRGKDDDDEDEEQGVDAEVFSRRLLKI